MLLFKPNLMGKHTGYGLLSPNNTRSTFSTFMNFLKTSLHRHQNNMFLRILGIPVNSMLDGFFNYPTALFSFLRTAVLCWREKKVPKLIHRWLKVRSIAYWYMDDGAEKWKGRSLGVRFCTDNFVYQDVVRLAQVLQNKYPLKTSLQKKGKGWRIYVSSSSYTALGALVLPYLVPSMLYKFPVPVTQI